MKLSGIVVAVVCTLLLAAGQSFGRPNYGASCSNCHGTSDPALLNVVNEDTSVDLPEDTRGTLKVFQVAPGATKSLDVEIIGLSGDDKYAVEIKRFDIPGVVNGGTLVYAGDAGWTDHGNYFSDPGFSGYTWPAGPASFPVFQFDIAVDASTPLDYYDLEFAVAGKSPFFYGEEHFYLQVIPEPATLAVLAVGFAGAALSARRRRKA